MRYMFKLTLHQVELHVPYEVQVIVVLKRGHRRLETLNNVMIGSGKPIADFSNEEMMMMTTVQKDKASKKFQDKIVSISYAYVPLMMLIVT